MQGFAMATMSKSQLLPSQLLFFFRVYFLLMPAAQVSCRTRALPEPIPSGMLLSCTLLAPYTSPRGTHQGLAPQVTLLCDSWGQGSIVLLQAKEGQSHLSDRYKSLSVNCSLEVDSTGDNDFANEGTGHREVESV